MVADGRRQIGIENEQNHEERPFGIRTISDVRRIFVISSTSVRVASQSLLPFSSSSDSRE